MSNLAKSLRTPQTARARARFGERSGAELEVVVTPAGLLAIGGLVSAILLSVPPIVRAARLAPRTPTPGVPQ